jgi:hypothetical protein
MKHIRGRVYISSGDLPPIFGFWKSHSLPRRAILISFSSVVIISVCMLLILGYAIFAKLDLEEK